MEKEPSPTSIKERAKRLQALRVSCGFATASEAARALGVPQPTYLSHEGGTRGLVGNAEKYAVGFGSTEDWILEGKGPMRVGLPNVLPPENSTTSPTARSVLEEAVLVFDRILRNKDDLTPTTKKMLLAGLEEVKSALT